MGYRRYRWGLDDLEDVYIHPDVDNGARLIYDGATDDRWEADTIATPE